jgi:Transposase/Transposase IS116/IS110/IS902 family
MTETFAWWVGVDWGSEAHAVCMLDGTGRINEERVVAHTVEAVQAWLTGVLTRTAARPAQIAVAIETPRGVLVETLLAWGFAVFALNPKQLDRFRDRFTVAGAKDDRRDAHVLGDSLRTDGHAFRRIQLDDPLILELRERSRAEAEWQRDLARFTNRVREQVLRIAPALLPLCPAADEPWFWTLLEHAALPAARQRLTRARVRTLLKRHRIRRLSVDDVWTQVQAADFVPAPGVVAGVQARLFGLLAQVRVTATQYQQGQKEIERVLHALAMRDAPGEPREHRDVEILRSLPGVGRMVTATMLAEAARPVAERDYHTLRSCAGIAPVTEKSGKRYCLVKMRRACNQRLREAAYHWGRTSLRTDPASRAYYGRLRHRGHTHGRALRSVVDRWFRILIAMLLHRTLYDPTRFASPDLAVAATA